MDFLFRRIFKFQPNLEQIQVFNQNFCSNLDEILLSEELIKIPFWQILCFLLDSHNIM